jgi:hypothetical protein
MAIMDSKLEKKVNDTWNIAVFLQMISSFDRDVDWRFIKAMTTRIDEFLKTASDLEIVVELPEIRRTLEQYADPLIKKFPLKNDINVIARSWNDFFKGDQELYDFGLEYGWLEEQLELKNYRLYDYVPYHFRLGLVAHKGRCYIEEDNLLKDAFKVLLKAEYYQTVLEKYGKLSTELSQAKGNLEFDRKTYTKITHVKFEVSSFSRLTVLSFFAFIEAFVNSVAYSFLRRNESTLSDAEAEILTGKQKGHYLQLRSKFERYQKIIRADKTAILITSDTMQMNDTLKTFFAYEELRNSAVHYSPLKEPLSITPKDWLTRAREFSRIAMNVGLQFWNACYPGLDAPEYLGRLDYKFNQDMAKSRLAAVQEAESLSERESFPTKD